MGMPRSASVTPKTRAASRGAYRSSALRISTEPCCPRTASYDSGGSGIPGRCRNGNGNHSAAAISIQPSVWGATFPTAMTARTLTPHVPELFPIRSRHRKASAAA